MLRFFYIKIIPYAAFLGTALVIVVQDQQLNFVHLIMVLALILSVASITSFRISLRGLGAFGWFFLATLPGTILFLIRGESWAIPAVQYLGLIVILLIILNLFRYLNYSPENIFNIYLQCAKIAASMALIQQAAYFMGIESLYDLRWLLIGAAELDYAGPFLRTSSLFTEPSYLAVFLIPALHLSILRLSGSSRQIGVVGSIIFILALLCSFSTIGYIGLLLSLLFAFRFTLRNMLLSGVILVVLISVSISSPALSSRLLAIPNAVQFDFQGNENLSTFINGLNLAITLRMLEDRPISGHGLGAYRVHSTNYLDEIISGNQILIDRTSRMEGKLALFDGGSKYFRLSSELGLAGLLLLAWLAYKHLGRPKSPDQVNLACAVLLYLLVFSIRSGQLLRFEFVFFLTLFVLLCFRSGLSYRSDFLHGRIQK